MKVVSLRTAWTLADATLPLAGDADLSKRVINAKGKGLAKDIWMFLWGVAFSLFLVFKLCPRSDNHAVFYHFIYNRGTFEVVAASVRFMGTPLLFITKFIVKSIVYPGRTAIIKVPLVRHVMPKKEVRTSSAHIFEKARGGPYGATEVPRGGPWGWACVIN